MVDRAMAKPQRGEKIVRQVQKAESESKTFRQGKSLISSHHQLTFPVPWLTILWKVDMGGKYDVNGGNMMHAVIVTKWPYFQAGAFSKANENCYENNLYPADMDDCL